MNFGSKIWRAGVICLCMLALPAWAEVRPRPRPPLDQIAPNAQTRPQPRPPQPRPASKPAPRKGPVTNLPIPRYVTLKGAEGNARRGPGLTHRIDWVFTTAGTPLRITAEFENWRRVEDFEGMGGWVHFTLLSGMRGVIITQDMAEFHVLPDLAAPVSFQAEAGALGRVLSCSLDWCRIRAGGERGWAPKSAYWGVDADEVIE